MDAQCSVCGGKLLSGMTDPLVAAKVALAEAHMAWIYGEADEPGDGERFERYFAARIALREAMGLEVARHPVQRALEAVNAGLAAGEGQG